MATNPPPSRINSVVNLPHSQGRLGTSLDIHIRKLEIVCVANSVVTNKLAEVFATTLQENAS